MKVKIIIGFKEHQYYTIEADEAHKAYYLFLNPEKRGVFNNGVAVIGSSIRAIEPDYHATMGWNPEHKLDVDDWTEIRGRGVDRELREILSLAKQISQMENPPINKPLSEAIKSLPPKREDIDTSGLADKMRLK